MQWDWNRLYVTIWYSWIGFFLLWEAYAGLDGSSRTPMLTNVVVREVPWWFVMPIMIWLPIHFGSRYLGRPIL